MWWLWQEMTKCNICDGIEQGWQNMTGMKQHDKTSKHLCQNMTIVSKHDNCGKTWRVRQNVIILQNLTSLTNQEKCDKIWQVWQNMRKHYNHDKVWQTMAKHDKHDKTKFENHNKTG